MPHTTTFFIPFKKSSMRIGALRWFCNALDQGWRNYENLKFSRVFNWYLVEAHFQKNLFKFTYLTNPLLGLRFRIQGLGFRFQGLGFRSLYVSLDGILDMILEGGGSNNMSQIAKKEMVFAELLRNAEVAKICMNIQPELATS